MPVLHSLRLARVLLCHLWSVSYVPLMMSSNDVWCTADRLKSFSQSLIVMVLSEATVGCRIPLHYTLISLARAD